MEEIQVVTLHYDRQQTMFMQATGTFESFKVVFAGENAFTGKINPGQTVETILTKIINASKDTPFPVFAVHLKASKEMVWLDEKIKSVSDGGKWCLLEDLLKSYNFPVKIQETPCSTT